MNEDLANIVRQRFETQLLNAFPWFEKSNNPAKSDWPQFEWHPLPQLWFFVRLLTSEKALENRFTIEVGWSKNAKYPWNKLEFNPEEVGPEGGCFRISKLWSKESEYWWNLGSDSAWQSRFEDFRSKKYLDLAAVDNQMADTIKKISDHVPCYFEGVAAAQGFSLKIPPAPTI